MRLAVALTLLFLVLLIVFLAQNTETVTVRFLVWRVETSRAFVVLGVFAIGAALGATVTALARVRH